MRLLAQGVAVLLLFTALPAAAQYDLEVTPDHVVLPLPTSSNQTVRVYAFFFPSYFPPYDALVEIELNGVVLPGTIVTNEGTFKAYADFPVGHIVEPTEMFASAKVTFLPITGFPETYSSTALRTTTSSGSSGLGGMGRKANFIIGTIRIESIKGTGYTLTYWHKKPVKTPEIQFENPLSASPTLQEPILHRINTNPVFTIRTTPSNLKLDYVAKLALADNVELNQPNHILFDTLTTLSYQPFASPHNFQTTNAIPNFIAPYLLYWDLHIRAEFTTTGEKVNMAELPPLEVFQHLLTCFDKPQQVQEIPWANILVNANRLAYGSTNRMAANSNLVAGFYDNAIVAPGQHGYTRPAKTHKTTSSTNNWLGTQYTTYQHFWPIDFSLNFAASNSGVRGNCSDFANYLACMMYSISSAPNGAVLRFSSSPLSDTMTKSISLASNQPSQVHTNWVYHQVFVARTGSSAYVYDATMKISGNRIIDYPLEDYYSDAFSSDIIWKGDVILFLQDPDVPHTLEE
jgi:hypothetical protein